ncbi:lysozyme [Rhodanobacter sp. A1T4]|uniref:lysozyme n=1 Tax=Rhodanobacter sp. A1T4 TaxID=2723087 RepID=UPI0031F2DBDB
MAYQITPRLTDFIVGVEGERLVAYLDTNGTLTIGVGHTGPDVTKGLRITPERSRQLLQADLSTAVTCVNRYVRVPLTEAQWIALVSFTFNEGIRRFQTSTLLRLLNAGDYAAVPAQLVRWNKETVKGVLRINDGLTNRRAAEIKLWNSK